MPGRSQDALAYATNPLAWLRRQLGKWGIEAFAKRFYGIYPGQVIDNKDPSNLGRIRAIIPAIGISLKEEVPAGQWCMPCSPALGNNNEEVSEETETPGEMSGMFFPPDVGTNVWVCFQWGDTRFPVYMGGFATTRNTSDTFTDPLQKGIRTRSGHFLRFDDRPDELSIMIAKGDGKGQPTQAFLSIDKDDNVQLSNGIGAQLFMNAKDKEISLMNTDGADPATVESLLFLGKDEITLSTKSGGSFGIKKGVFTANGSDFIMNCSGAFSANTGSVSLGKGAAEPAVKGMMLMTNLVVHAHPNPGFGVPVPQSTPPVVLYKELSSVVRVA